MSCRPLVPLVPLALLALAGTAHAGTLRLSPTFSPNPTVTDKVKVRVENSTYVSDLGYRTCDAGGGSSTTHDPAFTFELTADLPELRVRLEDGHAGSAMVGGVIVFPDGSYVCEGDHDDFYLKDWPKGTYKLWLYGNSTELSAWIRFEVPGREKDAVTAALATLPTVKLGSDGANGGANPAFLPLAPTVAAEAGDVGACGQPRDRVMPLATIEISKRSAYLLRIPDVDLTLLTSDDKCVPPTGDHTLEPGTYQLWATVPAGGLPDPLLLEADDPDRALAFGDAPRTPVGDLAAPLVLDGTVRAAERWPSRSGSCGGAARAPDLYLTADDPVQHVELSLLWSKRPQVLHVYGPLAKMTSGWRVDCGDEHRGRDRGSDVRTYDLMEGTYAIWVGSADADDPATGDTYHVLVRRSDVALDPLTTLAAIPDELTLAERPYPNHYPYFEGRSGAAWSALFTTAPDSLFAYARVDVDGDGDDPALHAGEPVVLAWYGDDYSAVHRYDGSSVRVRTQLLTTARPATVWLPAKPTVRAIDEVATAIDAAGPEDAKPIAAYRKTRDKYDGCLYTYLSKHDPTWSTGDTVYRISSSGAVTNVGDQVWKAGDRKCGGKKVDKAAAKLVKTLAKTRTARAAKELAAVRARFGAAAP